MVLVIMAGSWMAGVYLATQLAFSWLSVLLFLSASALLAVFLRVRGLTVLPALALAVLCLGALRAGWPPESSLPLPIQGYNGVGHIVVEGFISADPEPIASGWRFPLSVKRVKIGEEWKKSHGYLQVVARPSSSVVSARQEGIFRYGDRLVLMGEAEEPGMLEEFDYRDFLARQGIFSTMSFPIVDMAGEGEGNVMLEWVYALRQRLSLSLSKAVAEPQNSLAQALLLGRRSTMPDEMADAFRDTGTSHLLAISGLHVGVLLGISLALSRWLIGARRHLYLLVPLLSIWGYAALSGMSPSVERAAIMGSIYLGGLYLGRQNSIMPALAAAAAVMVGLQPRVISNVSFQLSFTAMAGLALLAPPIERTLRRVLAGDETEVGWSRALAYAVAATLAATVATLPLVAFYFHQVSLVGLPATLLAMPALAPILGTGLITALLGLVDTGLAQVVGWSTWLFLYYLKLVVELFDVIPGGTVSVGQIGAPLVVAYYGVLLGLIAGRSRLPSLFGVRRFSLKRIAQRLDESLLRPHKGRVYWALLALLLLASAGVWSAALSKPDGQLHVTFLDVGQGDAIFIVTPGGRQVLIDGGPDPQRLLTLLGSRMPFWDHSLDLVVLTHPHEDHVASATEVLRRYDVGLVLEREFDYPSPEYTLWRSTLVERGVPVQQAVAGQRIVLGDGAALDVVYPPDRLLLGTTSDVNNASVATRLVYGEVSFLLTGDLQWDAESYLLHRSVPLQSTVLKVAHQGSNTSTTPAFLREVSPEFAVISVGEDNRFGHPHQQTMDTLAQMLPEDHILTTSEHGSVEFVSDGTKLWIKSER